MTTINDYYLGVRMLADRVGVDVWDINHTKIDAYLQLEERPISRFWFGSPCRLIRRLDVLIHVYLPNAIEQGYPELATYLRQRHLDGVGVGVSGRLQVANTCGIRYTEYMEETPPRNGVNMIELKHKNS